MENHHSHKFARPLSICPPSDSTGVESDLDSSKKFKANFKRNRMTPQSSPVIDYCQIDLTCTYALREVDRILGQMKSRDNNSHKDTSKNGSSEDVESFKSFDQTADNYSVSSAACSKERKQHKLSTNKRYFRKLFSSRKAESTN